MTRQQTSMRTAGWLLMGTGAVFALAALPILHPVAHVFLQVAYWPLHSLPAEGAPPVPLLLAITGGLTAGLGGMLWALGTHVAGTAPQAATDVARWAAWVWFCVDSTGSLLAGAPMNVALNGGFLALMLLSSRPLGEVADPQPS